MNDLERKNLLQTEAQISDELSVEDLGEIAGGCPRGPKGGYNGTLDFWRRTDSGPNVLRYVNKATEAVGDWLKGLV